MAGQILIVDDEPSIRKVVAAQLRRDGHDVHDAEDGDRAIEILRDEPIDVVLTDLRMPGIDGMGLVRWVQQTRPQVPVIVLTAYGSVDTAVEAVKAGAFDFLAKPFDQQELRATIQRALSTRDRRADHLADDLPLELLGDGAAVRTLREILARVSPTPAPVLIHGERGTGKEVVGRAIHHASPRREHPLLEVHLSAVEPDRMLVELFGVADTHGQIRPGRCQLADGGSLILADIDRLTPPAQRQLLRLLQDGVVEPVGGGLTPVDVRLIILTDRPLEGQDARDRLDPDLRYRLSVVPLHLPPLRSRLEDLPTLARHMLQQAEARLGLAPCDLTDEALARLASHHWPGNLRELETILERAALLADHPILDADDLVGFQPQALTPDGRQTFTPPSPEEDAMDLKSWLRQHVARLERQRILYALREEEHNVTHAARRLGISRRSLQTKMKEYGLRQEEPSSSEVDSER